MGNKKEKLVKTVEKRQEIDENPVEEVQWLKRYQIFQNLLIPNTENQKKTLIMRKQLPFLKGAQKKQKNNCYLLTKWRTNIKFPIARLHEILFWLKQASYKHC